MIVVLLGSTLGKNSGSGVRQMQEKPSFSTSSCVTSGCLAFLSSSFLLCNMGFWYPYSVMLLGESNKTQCKVGWLQGNPWFMSVIITASSTQCCDNRCLATEHISLVGSCFLVLISKTILLVNGGCNFLGSVLPQQKFEVTDGPVLQLSVTGQFYLTSKGKYILKARGQADPKDAKRREARDSILALPFMFLFSSPWACPM